jgi:hypothetical protein
MNGRLQDDIITSMGEFRIVAIDCVISTMIVFKQIAMLGIPFITGPPFCASISLNHLLNLYNSVFTQQSDRLKYYT